MEDSKAVVSPSVALMGGLYFLPASRPVNSDLGLL